MMCAEDCDIFSIYQIDIQMAQDLFLEEPILYKSGVPIYMPTCFCIASVVPFVNVMFHLFKTVILHIAVMWNCAVL